MPPNEQEKMGPESPITVKVNFNGSHRRLKLPLRQMCYPLLELQLRSILLIAPNTEVLFERYSDSASKYVALDGQNAAIYKQLMRAAKAKSKLKIRVTTIQPETKVVPQPASVEDEAEETGAQVAVQTAVTTETPDLLTTKPVAPVADNETAAPTPAVSVPKPLEFTAAQIPRSFNSPYFENRLNQLLQANANYADRYKQLVQDKVAAKVVTFANATATTIPDVFSPYKFAVSCNNCENIVPKEHYHCSSCEDGDFDLCEACVSRGVTCHDGEHWLIKRTIVNGKVVQSFTETLTPKNKQKGPPATIKFEPTETTPSRPAEVVPKGDSVQVSVFNPVARRVPSSLLLCRTCNGCVQELPEDQFVHCEDCADFDLCKSCFSGDKHGHDPSHAFTAVNRDGYLPDHIRFKLSPGRNQSHPAICDGCDKAIHGVRHKCLDCPDWDYCSECVTSAGLIHPKHRFVPIYTDLPKISAVHDTTVHVGICCDGPLCARRYPAYIRGIRYKCSVCPDLDFCAKCEACPTTEHNATHPLIKLKTPVNSLQVSTVGQHGNGRSMPRMGDSARAAAPAPVQKKEEPVQKVTVKEEEVPEAKVEIKAQPIQTKSEKNIVDEDLLAEFVQDTVADGTIMPANFTFEQTWTLRNNGTVTWPAGCFMRYSGGDPMLDVDAAHPVVSSKLAKASRSEPFTEAVAPKEEASFTMKLRTPANPGKAISYWRLCTSDGQRFGDRLWCDVNVRDIDAKSFTLPNSEEEQDTSAPEQSASQMVFPKLEKESPVSSIHEPIRDIPAVERTTVSDDEDYGDCGSDELSEDGFLTDEEYDILDASDEEFLEEQRK